MDHFIGNLALGIDDEKPAQGHTAVRQYSIRFGDFFIQVGEQRVFDLSQASFFSRCVDPSQMRVLAVDRTTDHLGVQFLEFFNLAGEINDLSRANKGEIEWIEKKDHPFSLVLGKGNVPE